MMTVNVDTSDGLVNGATGVLREIGFSTSNTPNILWIEFLDESIGVSARLKCSHRQEPSWTPVVKIIKSFQINSSQATTIDRKQFPVVPAEAITFHKSQGATYNKVVVHTSSGMQRAALYVACSRATSAAGLYIIGPFVPPRSAQDSASEEELRELRSAKLLNTHFDCLLNSPNLHVFFHNTESLHCHISDVCSDQLMLKSSLLCFVEASTYSNEAYDIPGFTPAELGQKEAF